MIIQKVQCEKYITDPRFQVHEVQLLFSLRSRSYPVKCNLKNKYRDNLSCFLCNSSVCDQQHLMTCVVLRKFVPEMRNTSVNYSDIFSENVDNQLAAVKLFNLIDKQRERLLETLGVKWYWWNSVTWTPRVPSSLMCFYFYCCSVLVTIVIRLC